MQEGQPLSEGSWELKGGAVWETPVGRGMDGVPWQGTLDSQGAAWEHFAFGGGRDHLIILPVPSSGEDDG